MIIHWSDWAQQPEIRIACTQQGHHPWTTRKDLPDKVHEVPAVKGRPEWLYTFETGLVTCEACRKLATFQRERKRVLDFEQRGHTWSSGGPGMHCMTCGVLEPLTVCLHEHEQPCHKCKDVPPCDEKEALRPPGTVELECGKCGWFFWVDALHPMLPDGPFVCHTCEHGPGSVPKGGE